MSLIRRTAFVILCGIAVALLPGAAAAAAERADLDGDGARDRIEVGTIPTELAVRFAGGRKPLRLQAGDLILQFVIADVNRDGHPDLVADTRRSGLKIWINRGRGRFASRSRRWWNRSPLHAAIRAVQGAAEQESAVNDPVRLFVVLPQRHGERLEGLRHAQTSTSVHISTCSHRRRIPRGPPPLLVV
jgi:hypothetical protein